MQTLRTWVGLGRVLVVAAMAPATLANEPSSLPDYTEVPDQARIVVDPADRVVQPSRRVIRGGFTSVQVNVDAMGNDIVGDAGNETSIAVDRNDPSRIAIGWRQFDTIASNFRQAGLGVSSDGGATWTVSTLEGGTFRSDPVLATDRNGDFHYQSLSVPGGTFQLDVFKSTDVGVTWSSPTFAFGGDKNWFEIDRSGGMGDGHLYGYWTAGLSCCGDHFNRSVDDNASWESPLLVPSTPRWGTLTIARDGTLWVVGTASGGFVVARSTTAQNGAVPLSFDTPATSVNLGGSIVVATGPNPVGLLGQTWIDTDRSTGPDADNLYVLASVDPPGPDPLDVHFIRSTDGGATWSAPLRVNDDAVGTNAWQWFGTMSVAPNGRIDVVWNDSRNDPGGFDSEVRHAFSDDGGQSFSASRALTPSFDPAVGYPQQNKIGDYYDMVSENSGAHLAYSATFNGGQDVYYLWISAGELFADGFESGDTSAWTDTVP